MGAPRRCWPWASTSWNGIVENPQHGWHPPCGLSPGALKSNLHLMRTAACLRRLLELALATIAVPGLQAQVLWDADRGSAPSEQGWNYLAFGGPAVTRQVDGALELDTTSVAAIQAGLFRLSPTPLDRKRGFVLEIELALLQESHLRTDRAGLSLIVLDQEARGIELAFHPETLFAQAAEPLFARGEEAGWPGGPERHRITLTMRGDGYRLHVDEAPVLEGPLRAYWEFAGVFDPYETPNLLFLGDDTTSAAARIRLWKVRLAEAPRAILRPDAEGGWELRWEAVEGMRYGIEQSRDLRRWQRVATLEAATETAVWLIPLTGERRFFRVALP